VLDLYTTAPSSVDRDPADYRRTLLDAARWTERAGCRGLLVYSDNSLADPWATAQYLLVHVERVVPMVAVQPEYMSPYTAARMVSTLALLHGRVLDINLVTGGFDGHLRALDCRLDHDERYGRMVEYGTLMHTLLTADRPTSYAGRHYRLHAAGISPQLPAGLMPRFFLSGSSPAGIAAQQQLGMRRFAYPLAAEDYPDDAETLRGTGIRIGIVARPDSSEAWSEARRRFPVDSTGEQYHDLASRVVESSWHRSLSAEAMASHQPRGAYWLYPFRAYKTFCPYLVGSYSEVADTLAAYLGRGVDAVILDEPHSQPDLDHAVHAVELAQRAVRSSRTA
jgi:alkanesulfonate monooxygenase